jgi:hypothetical protein
MVDVTENRLVVLREFEMYAFPLTCRLDDGGHVPILTLAFEESQYRLLVALATLLAERYTI